MKLMSFNIRCDFEQDGIYSFRYRRSAILEMIAQSQPDVICFQEVLPHVAAWLRQNLRDYYILGCGRDEQLGDEQLCIAYRPERFMLCEFNTFWLSPAPDVIASRFSEDQSRCPRTCSEIVLKDLSGETQKADKASHKQGEKRHIPGLYRIFNVHLDHQGPAARRLGLALILARAANPRSFPEAKVILAGDFNCLPESTELAALRKAPWCEATAELDGTFHDFGRQIPEDKIDYVFLHAGLEACAATLLKAGAGGIKYYSDHHPLLVELGEQV